MTGKLFLALGLFAVGCSSSLPDRKNNRWADEALWNVLQAQDRRDVAALCNALDHADAEVRRSAALAFASVQDTTGIPCLTGALDDPEPRVRAATVFALGLVADSALVVDLAERAVLESDTSVQRAYLQATFREMVRTGMLRDPNAILYYLDRNTGHERVRAADALRRLSADTLRNMQATYVDLVRRETDPEVQAMLVRGLRGMAGAEVDELLWKLLQEGIRPVRVEALRVLVGRTGSGPERSAELLQDDDATLRTLAAQGIARAMTADNAAEWVASTPDEASPEHALLLGGAMAAMPDDRELPARAWEHQATAEDPHLRSAYLRSLGEAGAFSWIMDSLLMLALDPGQHALVRSTATEVILSRVQDLRERGDAPLIDLLTTQDPGLVALVAEHLAAGDPPSDPGRLLATLSKVNEGLDLPRDFEAHLAIARARAHLQGSADPAHERPPFDHPIDRDRLLALENGRQYRILTDKGEVTLALEVDVAPGSCVAFDSLVTAGYYDGKTFHRQVPGFVVQGGCPRGDGFGSMDWTLRTEVGLPGFSTGAVGLASAGPDTESCQFFIMLGPAPHLDGRYTRFAHVVDGLDVVQRLQVGDVMRRVERLP
ncbi:MAG: peptidylprolyl isomerase [Flavobacteriales bacterium]